MNLSLDVFVLGWLLALLGVFQLPAVVAALFYGEAITPYTASALLSLGAGLAMIRGARTGDRRLRPRDGFLVVGLAWILASLGGALPFIFAGVLGPVDAFFEAVAGFTTTGSTVMSGLESMPRALLLWRSITQWVGGMGIILFTIAILPLLGIGGMQLFKAEVPGPVADKVRPRVAETARRLWMVYVGFTVAEALALIAAGMSPFEAVCHSMTTLATGGFSTRDTSIAGFDSATIEWIITFFMLVAGMNFVLHYRLLCGRFAEVWRDSELRYFFAVVAVNVVGVAGVLLWGGSALEPAVRESAFTVASIISTTGYVTANFELWPSVTRLMLLILMVLGGMSGSTAGGVKSLRALLGMRALRASFDRLLHPRAVRPVKHDGHPVPEEVLAGIWAFFTGYFLIIVVATAIVAAAGYDLETSFSATLSATGNVGPGLAEVGAYDNFAHFPPVVKVVLSFCMLAGRLEVFTLLVLLMPQFWRR